VSATPYDQTLERPAAPAAGTSVRARLAAIVTAAVLAGGGAGFVAGHETASSGSAAAAPSAFGGAPSGAFGGRGGVAGEQHVQGTITATGTGSLTVKTSSGSTATYAIESTTQIVRNGQTTTLSALQAGDPVVVHVVPSSSGSSSTVVELVLAGSSATDPGFGAPPVGTAPSGTAPSGTAPRTGSSTGATSIN
jgi:hypothetical protein